MFVIDSINLETESKPILDCKAYDTSWFYESAKLKWLKITISTRSHDSSRKFKKLKQLFLWYCPIKFETALKLILGSKSSDARWMYFWRISNCSGCWSQFQMGHVRSVKTFLLWLTFCFLLSKLIWLFSWLIDLELFNLEF